MIPSSEYAPSLAACLTIHSLDVDYSNFATYTEKLLQATAGRFWTPQDFFERNLYFFRTPARPAWVNKTTSDSQDNREHYIANALQQLGQIPKEIWNETELKKCIDMTVWSVSEQLSQPLDTESRTRYDVSRVLRTILLAGDSGPALVETMLLLGRDVTLKRVKAAAVDSNAHE